jgi:hypothetical protein
MTNKRVVEQHHQMTDDHFSQLAKMVDSRSDTRHEELGA